MVLVFWMQAKEDVIIDPLFPSLMVDLIHMGPNMVMEKRDGEGRLNLRFRI